MTANMTAELVGEAATMGVSTATSATPPMNANSDQPPHATTTATIVTANQQVTLRKGSTGDDADSIDMMVTSMQTTTVKVSSIHSFTVAVSASGPRRIGSSGRSLPG